MTSTNKTFKELKVIKFGKIKYFARMRSLDEMIINEVWNLGMYSKYLNKLGSKPTIVDVGAHIGAFALLAAHKHPQSTIYCYEPHPDNFCLLKKKLPLMDSKIEFIHSN